MIDDHVHTWTCIGNFEMLQSLGGTKGENLWLQHEISFLYKLCNGKKVSLLALSLAKEKSQYIGPSNFLRSLCKRFAT